MRQFAISINVPATEQNQFFNCYVEDGDEEYLNRWFSEQESELRSRSWDRSLGPSNPVNVGMNRKIEELIMELNSRVMPENAFRNQFFAPAMVQNFRENKNIFDLA